MRSLFLWQLAKDPPLEREFRFHDQRRWRSDFAHLESRTLIEIEGGIWVRGRHHSAAGFNADLGTYLEAGLLGWRVFRLGPEQFTRENVERLVQLILTASLTGPCSVPRKNSCGPRFPRKS